MNIGLLIFSTLLLLVIQSHTLAADFRILTTEEPPTNYTHDGQLTGTTTDIVLALKEKLNIDTPIEVLPWARAYRIAKSNPNILVFTAGQSPERIKHGFHFIGPVMTRSHWLISRSDATFSINAPDDIKQLNLSIGAMRGDWREKYFADRGFEVENATTHYVVLKMLAAGRIPLAISSDIEMPTTAKELGMDSTLFKKAYAFETLGSYILISKRTPKSTVEKWQKAFDELHATSFFQETADKWNKKLGFKIGHEKNKGFYRMH